MLAQPMVQRHTLVLHMHSLTYMHASIPQSYVMMQNRFMRVSFILRIEAHIPEVCLIHTVHWYKKVIKRGWRLKHYLRGHQRIMPMRCCIERKFSMINLDGSRANILSCKFIMLLYPRMIAHTVVSRNFNC